MKIKKIYENEEETVGEYDFLGFTKAEFEAILKLLSMGSFAFKNPEPKRFLVESITVNNKTLEITVSDETGEIRYAIYEEKKYAVPPTLEYEENGETKIIPASTGKATYLIKIKSDGSFSVTKKKGEYHPHEMSDGDMCIGNTNTAEEFLAALSVLNLDSLARGTVLTDILRAKIDEGELKETSGWEVKGDD